MTIRETTLAKLQQLSDSFLPEVNNFLDTLLCYQNEQSSLASTNKNKIREAWMKWFESVEKSEVFPQEITEKKYGKLLREKYKNQGLEL